jgi:ribosome-associated protein
LTLARRVAAIAEDKKGTDLAILDVEALVGYADFFVLATGSNRRQVQAIADAVDAEVKASGSRPRVEGYASGWWVLLETGGVILHVFQEDARAFYGLDHLWADAPRVNTKGRGALSRRPRIATES